MFNRRSFLKTSFLAAAAVASPIRIKADDTSKISDEDKNSNNGLEIITAKGKVSSHGNPIKGVVITDGVNCTVTNSNGEFKLVTEKKCKFIYISVPSGYKIPVNSDYTPFYFYSTEIAAGNKYLNFELEPDPNDLKHNFLLLADPQILDESDLKRFADETIVDINGLIANEKLGNVFSVACGDIVYDKPNIYESYKLNMSRLKIPNFSVLGNHDVDRSSKTDDNSTETFWKQFGPSYYSFNKGQIHYVVLDDVFWYGATYMGYINQKQLDWLANDLSFIPKGKTVVLFMHIPPYNSAFKRIGNKQPEIREVITNREALYNILDGYKSYFITGHMHESEFIKDGNSEIHVCGAVCGAWWTDNLCGDGTPNGYMLYSVDGNDLTWQYKSTGKPFDHQIRIFDEVKTVKKRILANVWGANSNWKINIYSNEKLLGQMNPIMDKDPKASAILDGPDLPKKHKWAESYNNYHMFEFKSDVELKNVVVEAVCDQGKVFRETL